MINGQLVIDHLILQGRTFHLHLYVLVLRDVALRVVPGQRRFDNMCFVLILIEFYLHT